MLLCYFVTLWKKRRDTKVLAYSEIGKATGALGGGLEMVREMSST